MRLPSISIIVPMYNEEKHIGKLLDSLMKLDYPKNKLEIIIVDDGSTDKSLEITSKYPVKTIKGPHKGVGVARNLGLKSASHEIIVFIDSDMIVDINFAKEIIKCFNDPRVAGGNNKELFKGKKTMIARTLHLRKILGLASNEFRILRSCRKKILKRVGGIDPDFGYYDDWELTMRIIELGYRVVYLPKAIVWHREPENLKELYRQSKWIGKSMISSLKNYKLEGFKRIAFASLCAFVPLYILFIFIGFPFNVAGIVGITLFLSIELKRIFSMYRIKKEMIVFLTPIVDMLSMIFTYVGIIQALIYLIFRKKRYAKV